jgi:2-polyprenyl-3-methyl-5-hydroxy-6-metoxy-1,4-benzoquinol methylase
MILNNLTIDYYQNNAQKYFDKTVNQPMDRFYKSFLGLIPNGGKILDAGCGSGRDMKAFSSRGYQVVGMESSENLARLAEDYTGQEILVKKFKDIDWVEEFDGVWAMASLLHVAKKDIFFAIDKLLASLKDNGIMFISLKQGEGEFVNCGRFYSYYTEESLREVLETHNASILGLFTSERKEDNQKWINVLLRKEK